MMRLSRNRSRAPEGAVDASTEKRPRGRGWGPFTGAQLTVVIVAVCAVFALPTAVGAAVGAFSNNSATVPALKATNANARGIGVQGTGKKFGVYSSGPLGVAAGKPLSCNGCVAPGAMSSAARAIEPLAHGKSESGVFSVTDGYPAANPNYMYAGITFVQPVDETLSTEVILAGGATDSNCPGFGSAAAGWLCIYSNFNSDVISAGGYVADRDGGDAYFGEGGGGFALAYGRFTVTAP